MTKPLSKRAFKIAFLTFALPLPLVYGLAFQSQGMDVFNAYSFGILLACLSLEAFKFGRRKLASGQQV